jgi:hypothetical protein
LLNPILSLCPLLRHREFDFYVAPGGFGVRADLVRVVHQRLRLLAREAREVPDQFDLEAEAVPVPADADVGRDRGVFALGSSSAGRPRASRAFSKQAE